MRLRERGDSIILCKFCEKADSPWWLPLVNMIAQRPATQRRKVALGTSEQTNLRKSEILSLGAAPGAIP